MEDVSAANWIVERLHPWDEDGVRVRSFVPEVFEAYARVFHPLGELVGRREGPQEAGGRTWAALAARRGVTLTPDIAFVEAAGVEPGEVEGFEFQPADGMLPRPSCESLATVLRAHASDPNECWFCLWEGNGALWSHAHSPLYPSDAGPEEKAGYVAEARRQDEILESTSRVETQHRGYFLFRGPLDAAWAFEPSGWYDSPNIWWPQDRSWIVVTEVDDYSTYVGGRRDAIEDVLRSRDLEAVEVTADTYMDSGPYKPRWR